jgi:DNA mismatch endonuclease (patch repair protein)
LVSGGWNRGIHLSEGHKRNIGNANRGKSNSSEQKEKQRIRALGNHYHTGKGHPLFHGRKRSHPQSETTRIAIGKFRKGKSMNSTTKEKISAARLRQILPWKDTSIEVKLQNALKERGTIFLTHYPIKGLPDIVLLEQKIAIFCDGCYWHGCPIHHPEMIGTKNDTKVTAELTSKGWKVIRFWEHEINENLEHCLQKIALIAIRWVHLEEQEAK